MAQVNWHVNTEQFNGILNYLIKASDWSEKFNYQGFDKSVDYDKYIFKHSPSAQSVTLEWDNYDEGSITGPTETIKHLKLLTR